MGAGVVQIEIGSNGYEIRWSLHARLQVQDREPLSRDGVRELRHPPTVRARYRDGVNRTTRGAVNGIAIVTPSEPSSFSIPAAAPRPVITPSMRL